MFAFFFFFFLVIDIKGYILSKLSFNAVTITAHNYKKNQYAKKTHSVCSNF